MIHLHVNKLSHATDFMGVTRNRSVVTSHNLKNFGWQHYQNPSLCQTMFNSIIRTTYLDNNNNN